MDGVEFAQPLTTDWRYGTPTGLGEELPRGHAPLLHLFRIANSLLVVAALLMGAGAASAQDYPNRPITIIVPFTPGATTDAVARLTRDVLERELGAPIVIDNRAGAAGTIGSTAVANAKPDGYTLLITVNAPITMNMYFQKSFPYDATTAFAPISLAAESLLVLAVKPRCRSRRCRSSSTTPSKIRAS